jgi:hypothetical protein
VFKMYSPHDDAPPALPDFLPAPVLAKAAPAPAPADDDLHSGQARNEYRAFLASLAAGGDRGAAAVLERMT